MTIKVGICGFGTAATYFHGPLLQCNPAFEVTHVFERTSSKSHTVLSTDIIIVRSMEALVQVSSIDLIVIATPTELHHSQAKMALLAGKHVVVDKPFTVTSLEATELIELSKQQGRVLSVFNNRRFDSDFLTVKWLVENKTLGVLKTVELHFDRYRPELKNYWKEQGSPGSGMLYDLGSHLIDQAIQLFGYPLNIEADIQKQRKGVQSDDYFRLTFTYDDPSKPTVIVTAGMLVKELGPKFVLEGDRGHFRKYGEDVQESQLRSGLRPGDADWGLEPSDQYGKIQVVLGEGSQEGLKINGVVESKRGCYEEYYNAIAAVIENPQDSFPFRPQFAADVITLIEEAFALQQIKINT